MGAEFAAQGGMTLPESAGRDGGGTEASENHWVLIDGSNWCPMWDLFSINFCAQRGKETEAEYQLGHNFT